LIHGRLLIPRDSGKRKLAATTLRIVCRRQLANESCDSHSDGMDAAPQGDRMTMWEFVTRSGMEILGKGQS
jgi:hypothetical protein